VSVDAYPYKLVNNSKLMNSTYINMSRSHAVKMHQEIKTLPKCQNVAMTVSIINSHRVLMLLLQMTMIVNRYLHRPFLFSSTN